MFTTVFIQFMSGALCSYLQAGEAVALVAGQLSIDEFSEKILSELWTLNTSGTNSEHLYIYLY